MKKAEYFAKHKAVGTVAVDPIEGFPPLFAKKLKAGEFQDCFQAKTVNGKDDVILDYARAAVMSIVTADGKPFFEANDYDAVESLDTAGLAPFVKAINDANGMSRQKKAEEAFAAKPSSASPTASAG